MQTYLAPLAGNVSRWTPQAKLPHLVSIPFTTLTVNLKHINSSVFMPEPFKNLWKGYKFPAIGSPILMYSLQPQLMKVHVPLCILRSGVVFGKVKNMRFADIAHNSEKTYGLGSGGC